MTFERYPELDTLLLANPGAVRDYKPEWGWDRYMVGGKMFAALLTTADDCAPEYQNHPMLTVKVAPEEGNFLQRQYPDILPGYYTSNTGSACGWMGPCRRKRSCACAKADMH